MNPLMLSWLERGDCEQNEVMLRVQTAREELKRSSEFDYGLF